MFEVFKTITSIILKCFQSFWSFCAFAYYYYKKQNNVDIVFWNTLCEALGKNQFLTNGGDEKNIDWKIRKNLIVEQIYNNLSQGKIVSLVEVDNYPYLIYRLKQMNPDLIIQSFYTPKINVNKGNSNNNLSVYITTLLNKYNPNVKIVPNLKGDSLKKAYQSLKQFHHMIIQ